MKIDNKDFLFRLHKLDVSINSALIRRRFVKKILIKIIQKYWSCDYSTGSQIPSFVFVSKRIVLLNNMEAAFVEFNFNIHGRVTLKTSDTIHLSLIKILLRVLNNIRKDFLVLIVKQRGVSVVATWWCLQFDACWKLFKYSHSLYQFVEVLVMCLHNVYLRFPDTWFTSYMGTWVWGASLLFRSWYC